MGLVQSKTQEFEINPQGVLTMYPWHGPGGAVVIPSGVTRIGARAFYGCSSLSSVVIPEGVTRIGRDVFSGCTELKEVYCDEATWRLLQGSGMSAAGVMRKELPSVFFSDTAGIQHHCLDPRNFMIGSPIHSSIVLNNRRHQPFLRDAMVAVLLGVHHYNRAAVADQRDRMPAEMVLRILPAEIVLRILGYLITAVGIGTDKDGKPLARVVDGDRAYMTLFGLYSTGLQNEVTAPASADSADQVETPRLMSSSSSSSSSV